MARLSAFIRQNVEPILVDWETFARSLAQGDTMDIAALRDHAKAMLVVIADDLDDQVSRMCLADSRMFMPGLNLTYTDRSSMAASGRSPCGGKEPCS
mgnify:CR=1 FL=1